MFSTDALLDLKRAYNETFEQEATMGSLYKLAEQSADMTDWPSNSRKARMDELVIKSLYRLAAQAANIAGWPRESRKTRMDELVWELGVILERTDKIVPLLTPWVFVHYVSMLTSEHRCVLLEGRMTQN